MREKTKSAGVVTAKNVELDVRRSLLETFAVNEKANQKLLQSVSDAAWRAKPSSGKVRTIAGIASNMHNVRLMWLGAADKAATLPAKLDSEKASRQGAQEALSESAKLISKLLEKGLNDPAGRVPNFKPDRVAFAGYLIAHDSHHRGQIALLAHQMGMPIPSKTSFGLWEWGTLWKECGFKS